MYNAKQWLAIAFDFYRFKLITFYSFHSACCQPYKFPSHLPCIGDKDNDILTC